jgi:Ca2+-binding EF-hand superfamily protein
MFRAKFCPEGESDQVMYQRIMRDVDTNKDGKIDFEEFLTAIRTIIKSNNPEAIIKPGMVDLKGACNCGKI